MLLPCVPEGEARPNPQEHKVAPCEGKTPRTPQASSNPADCAAGGDCNPSAIDQQRISLRPGSGTIRR